MTNQYLSPGEVIIRLPEVLRRTGLSRSSVYDFMRKKNDQNTPVFPLPIPLGSRSKGWLKSEIDAWIATKVDRRNAGEEVKQ